MSDKERVAEQGVDDEAAYGAAAGGAGGAVLGSVLGMAVAGPLGAAVGAGIGTLAGAAAGYAVDYDSHEADFRKEHEADPARARHTFGQASPAYRYGWESLDRPEFHDKAYDHVRTELHEGWTGSGDFADYEGYVRHGFDRRLRARTQDGSFAPATKE